MQVYACYILKKTFVSMASNFPTCFSLLPGLTKAEKLQHEVLREELSEAMLPL